MKFLKNDVVLLLAFILLFCFGLGFLRNDQDIFFCVDSLGPCTIGESDLKEHVKPKKVVQTQVVSVPKNNLYRPVGRRQDKLTDLSEQQLLAYMQPLFMTKSASAIISFLKHIPAASVFRIVRAIVSDKKNNLPNRVKLRIIFAGAQRQKSRKERCAFFDLISHDSSLQKGVKPLLVKAVEAGYSHMVHDILEWSKTARIGNISRDALFYAARHDDEDPDALRELFEAGVPINAATASELLCELTSHCTEGYSIPFLAETLGADTKHAVAVAEKMQNEHLMRLLC